MYGTTFPIMHQAIIVLQNLTKVSQESCVSQVQAPFYTRAHTHHSSKVQRRQETGMTLHTYPPWQDQSPPQHPAPILIGGLKALEPCYWFSLLSCSATCSYPEVLLCYWFWRSRMTPVSPGSSWDVPTTSAASSLSSSSPFSTGDVTTSNRNVKKP